MDIGNKRFTIGRGKYSTDPPPFLCVTRQVCTAKLMCEEGVQCQHNETVVSKMFESIDPACILLSYGHLFE